MFSGIIGFIGAGNMAQAIAFGLIDAGAIPGKNVIASAPSMNNLKKFKEKGATVTNDNNQVINTADIIFLSVKPQYLDTAINSLNNIPHETKLYVSILAGIRLETLQEKFQLQCNSKSSYKIIRVLPNTAVLVGAGCSVMAANASTPEEDISLVKSLMSVGGTCELIPENLINSCSAVCGSGPAFVSRDINSNLESNNYIKSVVFKKVTSHNSKIPVDEKSSSQEVLNYCYRVKKLSSSEFEGSDHSSADDSEVESISENGILRKNKFVKFEDRTVSCDNKGIHRFNYLKDHHLKDYGGFDLRQKISPRDCHSYVSNHFHNSEVNNCSSIYENYINESNCHSLRDHSRIHRVRFPRYFSLRDDYIWDRKMAYNNRRRYLSDYYLGRRRLVPQFRRNYFVRRRPSIYHSSYNEYYRKLYSKESVYGCDPFPRWNIGYGYGNPASYYSQNYSFELVGKRKISDIDYIYSQPFVKRSRHNPAFHPLQVVIMRFNQQDYISQNMAAKIRLTLILMINSTFDSGFSPKFESTNLLRNGHFLVSCSDEQTVDWLLKQHLMEEDGTPFVMMKLVDLPSMQVVDTFVTYNRQPVRQVLECLRCQNPSLCTDKWLLCKRSVYRSGQFLRFFIDKGSFKFLDMLKWKPYFQLCRLRFHKINIQEEEICVLCKLFSTYCSLCTIQS